MAARVSAYDSGKINRADFTPHFNPSRFYPNLHTYRTFVLIRFCDVIAECEEYSKYAVKRVDYFLLLLKESIFSITVDQCDDPTGALPSEIAEPDEFPHMVIILIMYNLISKVDLLNRHYSEVLLENVRRWMDIAGLSLETELRPTII